MNRFEGDGRISLEALPQYTRKGTHPIKVTRSAARRMIEAFDESGQSTHSGRGGTLWVLIEHCKTSGIKYRINGYVSFGFSFERV
jgi:hypothetical protein